MIVSLISDGHIRSAQEALDAVPQDERSTPYFLIVTATLLRQRGCLEDSLSQAQAVLKSDEAEHDDLALAWALRCMGVTLGMMDRPDDAIAAYDEVLRRFGDDTQSALREQVARALFTKGFALGQMNRPDDEIAAYDEVLQRFGDDTQPALREQVAMALANKGIALGQMDRPDDAIAAYDEVLRRFGDDTQPVLREAVARTLVNKGIALERMDKTDDAIAAYDEVLQRFGDETQPELRELVAKALLAKARIRQQESRNDEALRLMEEAITKAEGLPEHSQLCTTLLYDLTILQADMGLPHDEALDRLQKFNPRLASQAAILIRRTRLRVRLESIWQEKNRAENRLRHLLAKDAFIPTRPKLDSHEPEQAPGLFSVLRKWASYTPISFFRDRTDTQPLPHGGGYFLWWAGMGIVIDPGLDFGVSFREAGYFPRNINSVIATHHHIDHTGDMLPLLTCLYEMNSDASREHHVDFYLSPGAFTAHADMLAYLPGVKSLQLLRVGETAHLGSKSGANALITPVPATHRDLTGRDDAALGLVLQLHAPSSEQSCRIGFTGDTRLNRDSFQPLANVDLLVVHVGSVYQKDFESDPDRRDNPWHLGIMDTIELLTGIHNVSDKNWNPVILLSEWGEELSKDRVEICELIAEAVGFDRDRVLPAEEHASIALWPSQAHPVCHHCRGRCATTWRQDDDGTIRYLCDPHVHENTVSTT